MNISTLSRLPAEPLQMLGKSRRQIAEEAAAEAKRNAPPSGPPPMTSAPQGYEVTAQGGLRRKDQPWIVPETKGRAVKAGACLDSGEFVPADAIAQAMLDNGELPESAPADDSATCAVPSLDDLQDAVGTVPLGRFPEVWRIIDEAAGKPEAYCAEVPDHLRARVIHQLHALGE